MSGENEEGCFEGRTARGRIKRKYWDRPEVKVEDKPGRLPRGVWRV